MPPSGYSPQQTQSIVAFLHSCATALESECKGLSQALADGLRRESADIERVLPSLADDPFASHILRLTRDFYARVLELAPANAADYWSGVDSVLADVERSVLAIHVPSASVASNPTATA